MAALTNVELVRVLVKDQDVSALLFSDDEIDALLALNADDVYMASADAAFALAADASKVALAIQYGNYKKDARSVAREYRNLGRELKLKAQEAPAIGIASSNDAISTHLEIV